MTTPKMLCGYCNRRYPWDDVHFPSRAYAQCWWCRMLDTKLDQESCPRCGSEEVWRLSHFHVRGRSRLVPRRVRKKWLARVIVWSCRRCGLRVERLPAL